MPNASAAKRRGTRLSSSLEERTPADRRAKSNHELLKWAGESYIYDVVGSGLPLVFYKEFEDRQKRGREVEFRFADVVMFIAAAAASGVIGNFTYAAIVRAFKAIRTPKRELGGRGIRFEAVVSREMYNRIRRTKHPAKGARRVPTYELEQDLETRYRLMVRLVDDKK